MSLYIGSGKSLGQGLEPARPLSSEGARLDDRSGLSSEVDQPICQTVAFLPT